MELDDGDDGDDGDDDDKECLQVGPRAEHILCAVPCRDYLRTGPDNPSF